MRYARQLKWSLHNGLLFAVPVALSFQCESEQDRSERGNEYTTELSVDIDPLGTFVQELNQCFVDQDACIELCDRILVEGGIVLHPGETHIQECSVTKETETVRVDMTYTPYPMTNGCGVVTVQPGATTTLGSHFAAMAELEESSVYSFARLARDLHHHGAPALMVHSALRAAVDEVRHTQNASMLTHAWGGTRRRPTRDRHADRSFVKLCVDNAVDGCVHETFGAAIAKRQGRHASDPLIRQVMKSIARDESRHAELAKAINSWARPKLTPAQRQLLETRARRAYHNLVTSQKSAPKLVSERAGFPDVFEAQVLAHSLEVKRRASRS